MAQEKKEAAEITAAAADAAREIQDLKLQLAEAKTRIRGLNLELEEAEAERDYESARAEFNMARLIIAKKKLRALEHPEVKAAAPRAPAPADREGL